MAARLPGKADLGIFSMSNQWSGQSVRHMVLIFLPLVADAFRGFGVCAEEAMCRVIKEAQLLRGTRATSYTHLLQA